MNKKLLRKVARHIKTHPEQFDWTNFGGCVAFHIVKLSGLPINWADQCRMPNVGGEDIDVVAKRLAKLNSRQAGHLFYPGDDDSPEMAVKTINKLVRK